MCADMSDDFSRIEGRVDVDLLREKRVSVIGVGSVGSEVARRLAQSGIGRLRLVDGKNLERHHLVRHALGGKYVGDNKALGLAEELATTFASLTLEPPVPRNVDESMSDRELDELLIDADVVVVATDKRSVQRRIAERTFRLGIPTVLPGLFEGGGGEVFVQLDDDLPCFMCRDGFRPPNQELRGVAALSTDTLDVVTRSVEACLGICDPRSAEARPFASDSESQPTQLLLSLVIENRLGRSELTHARQPACPVCGSGEVSEEETPSATREPQRSQQPEISRQTTVIKARSRSLPPEVQLFYALAATLSLGLSIFVAAHLNGFVTGQNPQDPNAIFGILFGFVLIIFVPIWLIASAVATVFLLWAVGGELLRSDRERL